MAAGPRSGLDHLSTAGRPVGLLRAPLAGHRRNKGPIPPVPAVVISSSDSADRRLRSGVAATLTLLRSAESLLLM